MTAASPADHTLERWSDAERCSARWGCQGVAKTSASRPVLLTWAFRSPTNRSAAAESGICRDQPPSSAC
jgi:hypothetical protein